MNKSVVGGCLAIYLLIPAPLSASAGGDSNSWMWLERVSREEMRAQRAKRKAAMAAAGEKRADQTGESAKRGGEKKAKRGGYRRSAYYLHTGPFPKSLAGEPAAGTKPHGGMNHAARRSGRHAEAPPNEKRSPGHAMRTNPHQTSPTVWVKSPDNRMAPFPAKRRGPVTMVTFPAGSAGWYDLFAYSDQGVIDGSRVHRYSFTSFMLHGSKPEKMAEKSISGPGYFQGRPMLEIERLCADDHECYRTYAGQEVRVRVRFKGTPLANHPLTLITARNWRQTKRTDREGYVSFIPIKERFPEKIDRRKSENYLLTVSHTHAEMGMWNGRHYHDERHLATLPLRIYPSQLDWKSQRMAFLVGSGALLVAGGAIAIRRKQRRGHS